MPRPENENWYLVLELDFDPPVEDETLIQKRIDEKKDFWNRNANHYKFGGQYTAWRDAIPRIKKEMIGSENIRKQLAKEACELRYGEIDELLGIVGMKGEITQDEAANIAKQLKTTESLVQKRAKALKMKIVAKAIPAFDAQAVYDQYYKKAPACATSYQKLPGLLQLVGCSDLYAFLYGEKNKNAGKRESAETLRTKATEKRKQYVHANQASSNGKQLCGQCEMAFASEKDKKDYDEYLMYISRKAILDKWKKVAAISGQHLGDHQADAFTDELTELLRDADLAEQIVKAFCEIEKIHYQPAQETKKCRCGTRNELSRSICKKCGLPLEIQCPGCGKKNPAHVKFCDCGFNMDNIDVSNAQCDLAKAEIDKMHLDAAEDHLSKAKRAWAQNPRIAALQQTLEQYGKDVRTALQKLESHLKQREFFAAETEYTALKNRYSYQDASAETQIRDAKAEAKRLFEQAQKEKDKAKALQLCNEAFNACRDYPGIQSYITQHFAPEAPINLTVQCRTDGRYNVLSWQAKDHAADIRYRVIRKLNASPANVSDGTEVGVVSACAITDKNIQAGEAYYYAVFAERAGTCSKTGLITKNAVVNLFEVNSLSVAIGDGRLELLWGKLPPHTVIHIYQIEAKGMTQEIKALDCRQTRYVVPNLVNGRKYQFCLKLEYVVNGKSVLTAGAEISGTPMQPPKAVESMAVQYERGDDFNLQWNHVGEGEVRFYASAQAPNYQLGDTVSLAEIEKQMTRLMEQAMPKTADMAADAHKASFKHTGKDIFYVSAVTVKEDAAVFGSSVQAAKIGMVAIKKVRDIGGNLYIHIEAPAQAEAFWVLYSFDKQPSDFNDTSCERVRQTMREYAAKGALILPHAQKKKYYLAIVVEYNTGGTVTYSSLMHYVYNNVGKQKIAYQIHVKKKLVASSVEISFTSDSGWLTLPDIDLVGGLNRLPMIIDDHNVLCRIKGNGSTVEEKHLTDMGFRSGSVKTKKESNAVTVSIPLPKTKNVHIKPVISTFAEQVNYELVMTGGQYQIT